MMIWEVWASVEKGESKEIEQGSKLSDFASMVIHVTLQCIKQTFSGHPVSQFHVPSLGPNSLGSTPKREILLDQEWPPCRGEWRVRVHSRRYISFEFLILIPISVRAQVLARTHSLVKGIPFMLVVLLVLPVERIE
jgi:hypothetical protein